MQKTLIILSTFFCAIVAAQDITVSGTVFDADSNEYLPGASVVVSGSNVGTTTDFEGMFTIENLSFFIFIFQIFPYRIKLFFIHLLLVFRSVLQLD